VRLLKISTITPNWITASYCARAARLAKMRCRGECISKKTLQPRKHQVFQSPRKLYFNTHYVVKSFALLFSISLLFYVLCSYLSQFVGLGTCTASEHAAAAALEGSSRDHRRLGSHHQRLSNSRHQNQPSGHCRRLRASRSRRPSPGADTTAANTQSQPPLHPIPPPLSSSRDHSAVVAVKTSPSAVRQELKNWAEIMVWAIDHAAPWRNRLKLKSESALLGNCSRAVSDPRAGLPFPPTLVRPSLASPSSSSNKLRTVVAAAAAADSPQISRAPLSEASSSFSSSSASELPSGYHGLDLTALASLSHLTKARANLHRLHDEYLAMASGSSTHPKKSSRGHGKRGKHEHD